MGHYKRSLEHVRNLFANRVSIILQAEELVLECPLGDEQLITCIMLINLRRATYLEKVIIETLRFLFLLAISIMFGLKYISVAQLQSLPPN